VNESTRNTEAATIVIFGASGDLTQRKLVPALHSLACAGLLPEGTQVLGIARSFLSNAEFRDRLLEGVTSYARLKPGICELWPRFADRHTYLSGSYDDPETYRALGQHLEKLEDRTGTRNALFYLAVPPTLSPLIVEHLGRAGLSRVPGGDRANNGWRRIIIEKPFGRDLQSARELNEHIHRVFGEDQVYRIDHYLGKETVQNIVSFRFANAIFEPLWNRNYVDHVQITVAESLGVGHRGGYYDSSGVLRDMFQNHLLQLLTLTAMEPPAVFDAGALRDEKVKVLRAVRTTIECVRGQYRGYRDEPDVAYDSRTPTYAALKLFVDNWRWRDVPFYLRSGKHLAGRASEITVQFRSVPHLMFPVQAGTEITPNVLSICIQPSEGIHLRFQAKEPGARMQTRSVNMEFHYARDFGSGSLPEAYERLLLDALQGDASLFARADEIEMAWSLIDPVLAAWEGPDVPPPALYERGTWGPPGALEVLSRDGRTWHSGCAHLASRSTSEQAPT
jgi:glucose-6-phosphate 1-dehydrogenase